MKCIVYIRDVLLEQTRLVSISLQQYKNSQQYDIMITNEFYLILLIR